MRLYETAFLIAPNLPDEEREKLVNDLAGVVSEKKGKMDNIDNWGKRKLAYSVNKFNEAYYVFFLYQGEPEIPAELERRFKQTEAVIRYMTLAKDTRDNIRKKKMRPARKTAAPVRTESREEPMEAPKEAAPEVKDAPEKKDEEE